LKFDSTGGDFRKPAINEPLVHESPCWYAHIEGAGTRPFWIGSWNLPIDRVAGRVIESLQKAGISAALAEICLSGSREVEIA
jgi:hypothetical protein